MKLKSFVILLLIFINYGYGANVGPHFVPTATLTGGGSVCQNASEPILTFTGGNGTAPYEFTYQINGGANIIISSPGTSNIATLQAPTGSVGTFTYTLIGVKDAANVTFALNESVDVLVSSTPTVEFLFNDDLCSGAVNQFTSAVSGGSADNIYSWDFGDGSPLSNEENPTHVFTSFGCGTVQFSVVLTVTNNGCSAVKSHIITVKQEADLDFFDVSGNQFDNCSNSSSDPTYSISVGNQSNSACVTAYSIDWGDGTSTINATFPANHTYTGVGAFSMVISATVPNGCSSSRTYIIKNASNPVGGINSPGSTQNLCAPTALIQFSISNWGTNSLDTTYSVDYGDGTVLLLTQVDLVNSAFYNSTNPAASANYPVPYSYTTSNCPSPSFQVSLTITNACGVTPITLGNVTILEKPVASFTVPPIGCAGSNVLFTNTTTSGFGQNCSPNAVYKWDFGDGTPLVTTAPGPVANISHIYATPGTYTVILTSQGFCGTTTFTEDVCIEAELNPAFTLNTTTGCIPLVVTATNTTNVANQCSATTYTWEVSYAAGNCGSGVSPITNQTTPDANYTFTEAGTYTIVLKTTNSCGVITTSQTVVVKKPPTISLAAISDFCGSATISPVANVPTCVTASGTVTYAWSFPGGNPSTSTLGNPQNISYASVGNYTVSLVVTNECGASNTATQTFSVNDVPTITNTEVGQAICSGAATTALDLTASPTGATFSWTAVATAGITGFSTSGTTSNIPSQIISTTNASAGTVTYTVIPSIGNCTGTPFSYVITVNPAPVITSQPLPSTVCLNGGVTSLSVALNSGSATPTYQWYSNGTSATTGGTLIVGATASNYIPPTNAVGETYYYCIISLSSGGCSSLTSVSALVKVLELPTITTQPLASQSLCLGGSIPNPLSIAYSDGTGTAIYQWFLNTTNTATGGTAIAGATSANYTPPTFLTADTYYYYATVTLSGTNCGTATSDVAVITVFADPTLTTQPLTSQIVCQGAVPETLEVVATGGSGTFSYQWYSSATNATTGGTLITGATSSTFIPSTIAEGTLYYYCIISQDTVGCAVTSTTAEVIISPSPTVIVTPSTSSACLGGAATTLTLTITNGAGTPTYQWYSNSTSDNATGTLIAGEIGATFTPTATAIGTTYYYCSVSFSAITGSCSTVVTSAAEVTIIASATIDQNPVASQDLCVGATIATPLTVSYIDGTGTASYQWFSSATNTNVGGSAVNGATSSTFTPAVFATAGTFYYYVEISFSGNGCGAITSAVAAIVVVADPVLSAQPLVSQTLCQNALPTILAVTPSGGIGSNYQYQWYSSPTDTTTGGTLIFGATNATFVPVTDTVGTLYYYCIVSQDLTLGCGVTSNTAEVIINESPSFTTQPQGESLCVNQTAMTLTVNYTNGAGTPDYQWHSNTIDDTTSGTLINGATISSYLPSTSLAGSVYYYCVITFPSLSGGCEVITSTTALVEVNTFPIIGAESSTICSSNAFQSIPVNGGGNVVPVGTTYTWSQPVENPVGALTGFSAQASPQTEISQTLVNTTASPATVTYTVTPTSGICAGTDFTITVTVNPAINPNVTVTNNDCFGVNIASIATNITGGISPYTIIWSGPNGFTSAATTVSNLAPGIYTLDITDLGNCPFTATYTITEPTDLILVTESETDLTCFQSDDGSIAISVSGGTGAYSYTWTKNNVPFAVTEDLSNLGAGIYEVTVTDENNCGPKTASFTITEPPLLTVSLQSQTNVACFGANTGAITTTVGGGTVAADYNFAWTGPNGFTSPNQNLTALFAGTYNLIVTDDKACQQTLEVTIIQSTEIIISYTATAITCFGGNDATLSVTLSGGSAPYTFVWDNLSTSLVQNNLSAGSYTITVTDAAGCDNTATVVIPDAPIFTVNPVMTNISCFGANNGSINLNLVGGVAPVTLTWSDGSTAGLTRNNLSAGTYTATISDGTPCFIVRTFTIVEPQSIELSAVLTNPIDCTVTDGGAIDLIVSGGSPPFTFSWSNGSTVEDIYNLVAGTYSVIVVDANGCTISQQYTLIRPQALSIAVTSQTDVDCASHEVSQRFVAQASGGIPPFQYQWSSGTISGANNEIMTTNLNGTVLLTVTDSAGCIQTYAVDVNNLVLGQASFDTSSVGFTEFGLLSINDPIQFTSTITGDYESVSWDFGDGTFSSELNPIHTYIIPNNYVVTLTVTYPYGCIYTYTATLPVDKGYVLVLPNAFTPNKDGLNEYYRPVAKRLTEITLTIYDSWGSVIYYEKGDVIKGWDGKIKGYDAENGNYYSKVSGATFYGTIVYDNQTIVLIK